MTTGVGFAALALTPIPPVRVFGIFVAIGVFFAWLLTLVLLPALIVGVVRDGHLFVPSAEDHLRVGDDVYFSAQKSQVVRTLKFLAMKNNKPDVS